MNTDDSWFFEWYSHAAPEELRLLDRVNDFSCLFEDMLFKKGSASYELTKCQHKSAERDERIDVSLSLPDELEYFDYTWFHFKVESLPDGVAGCFDEAEQTLSVSPKTLEDDVVILHELIHLHEYVLDEAPMSCHDMVLWALYQDLRNTIPGLDNIISDHAHLLTGESIYSQGGTHDILFLLKSFDLDIRQGYPLGTVFGYGRCKEFEGYSHTKT